MVLMLWLCRSPSGKSLVMVLQKGTVLLVCVYSQFLLFAQKAIDNYFLSALIAGVLEANFIEPAHDKQDFERSSVFFRLEGRLKQMIMDYWFVYSKFSLTTFGLNVMACLVLGCNIHQSLCLEHLCLETEKISLKQEVLRKILCLEHFLWKRTASKTHPYSRWY